MKNYLSFSLNTFLTIMIGLSVLLGICTGINLFLTLGFGSLYFLFLSCLTVAVILIFVRLRSNFAVKKISIMIIVNILLVELFFQLIGWLNLFPSGIDVAVFSVPYGRIIKNGEGPKNSDIMNRYGWHYPYHEWASGSINIGLIGDSFIDGLQVKSTSNIGVRLEEFLKAKDTRRVFSFGIGGSGPAQYFELLKHAIKFYGIKEAFIFIFLGNDIQNSAAIRPNGEKENPSYRIQYLLSSNGLLVLHPDSKKAIELFNRRLDDNRKSMLINFPATVSSHLITPSVVRLLLAAFSETRKNTVTQDSIRSQFSQDLAGFGLSPINYKPESDTEAFQAIKITKEILIQCKKHCDSNGVVLRLVTIPWFSSDFYEQQDKTNWKTSFKEYDLLQFEKNIVNWTNENDISLLPMGLYMQNKKLTVNDIEKLYFAGKGHWTIAGHQFFAQALYESYYK